MVVLVLGVGVGVGVIEEGRVGGGERERSSDMCAWATWGVMRPCVFQKIAISVRDELTISDDLVRQERCETCRRRDLWRLTEPSLSRTQ